MDTLKFAGPGLGMLDARYINVTGDTMSGAITLANLGNALNSANYPLQMMSGVADGATAVGYNFDTTNTLATAGSKIFSLKNGGSEVVWIGGTGSNLLASFGANTVTGGMAFGNLNIVNAAFATAFGYGNTSGNNGVFTAGLSNVVNGLYGAGIGFGNTVGSGAFFSAGIGFQNTINAGSAYAFGDSNIIDATGGGSIALGGSNTLYNTSVAIGSSNIAGDVTLATNSLVIGNTSTSIGGNSTLVGNFSTVTGDVGLGLGNGFRSTLANSITFGVGDVVTPNPLSQLTQTNGYFDMTRLAIGRSTSVGTDLTTNGDFTGSAAGWTLGTSWAYGTNNVVRTANAVLGTLTQTVSGLVIGQVYSLTYKITAGTSANEQEYITPSLTGAVARTFNNRRFTNVSEFRETFIANGTSATITFTPTANWAGTIDYVYLKPITGGNLSVAGTSYLNTALSVGGATSTNLVDIAGGTTTKAQLHFESSTLKTTPVAGDMEYSSGHWYVTNGARHAITTSAGIKTSDTTVANTVTETTLYSYTFAADELHADEHITFDISGAYSNASASDDFTIRVKVGGVTIHTVNRVGGNQTNAGWQLFHEGTIRTTGATGTFVDLTKFLDNEKVYLQSDTSTHSIDTTITQLFEVTIQWVNAKVGNTFTCHQGGLTFNH